MLVFDSNGTPAAAEAVLAEIRRLTDKPVNYLVNSHWHWDHWYGSEVYVRAFPDIRVISQTSTRAMMEGPALAFNRPGLETQLPGYLASLEKKVDAAEHATPPPADLAQLKARLAADRFFLEQKKAVHHVYPNMTFADRLTLHMGDREIQVLHYDRAVTPGDAFLYLPKEKVLITGDLLVNPVSFALGCYPTGWLRTLERMDALDASVIVPGHGEPLHDKTLLRANMAVMRELLRERRRCQEARARSGSSQGGGASPPARSDGGDHWRRPGGERRVPGLSGRLVPAPGLRRTERPAHGRHRADSGEGAASAIVAACCG